MTCYTLQAFCDTASRETPKNAARELQIDEDFFEGVVAVWTYQDYCFLEEHPDSFAVHIDNKYWNGCTRDEAEARLFFDHYVSECVDDWTHERLTALLAEWCNWKGLTVASADELLAENDANEAPAAQRAEQLNRSAWLQWFIRTWEATERN